MNIRKLTNLLPVFFLVLLGSAANGFAATITIQNNDGPGEGFNDTTPVVPISGNSGTTLGQQRLNSAQAAADAWGAVLSSSITIVVGMTFDPLECDSVKGILGRAGPTIIFRDFPEAKIPDTWYVPALADSMSGQNLVGNDGVTGTIDIGATFNSDVDFNDNCLAGKDWWYGINSSPSDPNRIDFFRVLLHEIGHGIGFLSFVDTSGINGQQPTGDEAGGFPDAFEHHLEDHSLGKTWPDMTSAQRVASSTDTGDLHWTGAHAVNNSGVLNEGVGANSHIQMYAPATIEPGSSVSHWDTAVAPNELMEPFAKPDAADLVTYTLLRDIGWTISESATEEGGDCSGDGLTVDLTGRIFKAREIRDCTVTQMITAASGGINPGADIRFLAPEVYLGKNFFARGTLAVNNPNTPPPSCTPNTNVIVDGGFESGTPNPNWTESSTNFGSPICDASCAEGTNLASSGSWWSWFGGITEEEHGAVSQQVTIPAGPAQLQFQLWMLTCDSASDFLVVEIDGTTVLRVDGSSPLCGSGGYTLQAVDVSNFADGAQHTLQLRSSTFVTNGKTSNIFVDDVKLMACSP